MAAFAGHMSPFVSGQPLAQPQGQALSLARLLPGLVIAARQTSASVAQGIHGRRRAGPGEAFWQFRPFEAGEAAHRIDWRRSARDDRHYVREREWEASHTLHLWMDRSASMQFASSATFPQKQERAIVLGLALADLAVRGGERVALLGLTRPLASRDIISRLAEAIVLAAGPGLSTEELPSPEPLPPRSHGVMIGDFLSPPHAIARAIGQLASRGAKGHLLMVSDLAEETFPFSGHTELLDSDSPAKLRLGRAETMRTDYISRLGAHRASVMDIARLNGWSFGLHRTDRPASAALLDLAMRLEAGVA